MAHVQPPPPAPNLTGAPAPTHPFTALESPHLWTEPGRAGSRPRLMSGAAVAPAPPRQADQPGLCQSRPRSAAHCWLRPRGPARRHGLAWAPGEGRADGVAAWLWWLLRVGTQAGGGCGRCPPEPVPASRGCRGRGRASEAQKLPGLLGQACARLAAGLRWLQWGCSVPGGSLSPGSRFRNIPMVTKLETGLSSSPKCSLILASRFLSCSNPVSRLSERSGGSGPTGTLPASYVLGCAGSRQGPEREAADRRRGPPLPSGHPSSGCRDPRHLGPAPWPSGLDPRRGTPLSAHALHIVAPAGGQDGWAGALDTLWALRMGRWPARGLTGAAGFLVSEGPGYRAGALPRLGGRWAA